MELPLSSTTTGQSTRRPGVRRRGARHLEKCWDVPFRQTAYERNWKRPRTAAFASPSSTTTAARRRSRPTSCSSLPAVGRPSKGSGGDTPARRRRLGERHEATRDADNTYAVGDVDGKELISTSPRIRASPRPRLVRRSRWLARSVPKRAPPRYLLRAVRLRPRVGHDEETAKEAGYDIVTATRQASDDGVFNRRTCPRGLQSSSSTPTTGQCSAARHALPRGQLRQDVPDHRRARP